MPEVGCRVRHPTSGPRFIPAADRPRRRAVGVHPWRRRRSAVRPWFISGTDRPRWRAPGSSPAPIARGGAPWVHLRPDRPRWRALGSSSAPMALDGVPWIHPGADGSRRCAPVYLRRRLPSVVRPGFLSGTEGPRWRTPAPSRCRWLSAVRPGSPSPPTALGGVLRRGCLPRLSPGRTPRLAPVPGRGQGLFRASEPPPSAARDAGQLPRPVPRPRPSTVRRSRCLPPAARPGSPAPGPRSAQDEPRGRRAR
ncbi:hypothetical protein SAMN05421835_11458 [Amycolatopsis sacchari]|uniref:Uncharacterized protein n=1 Tax=Amycolatopsis sacchari TaxID=115433 RepID=A0A1I3WYY0_9PSEU|nr:hypothetical protein SAMN05421835_11458 [Amycolatopsis sacchari]